MAKKQVADYIAEYLVAHKIDCNFTVPGGGAMYLNMAFGNATGMNNVFMQHEQSAAIAAEAYARMTGVPALVCCTTGPGGTNTLTGVLGAWLDSIPMLVISGQVRYATTKMASGLNVRALGDQEFDIVPTAATMSKYAVTVTDPMRIRYHLEKALYFATHGRPGPVWLDIPQDVQRAMIESEYLEGFKPSDSEDAPLIPPCTMEQAEYVIDKIRTSERPVLNLGNGIRIAGAYEQVQKLIDLLGIPVVNGFNSLDTVPSDNDCYIGRAGIMGDRPGNWTIQNSDLLLSIGSRLSVRQVGYDVNTWAREAFTIIEDIDAEELKKKSIRVDFPVHADALDFVNMLIEATGGKPLEKKAAWLDRCKEWKRDYPVVTPAHAKEKRAVNVYYFMDRLSDLIPENIPIVTGNGSAYVVSSQVLQIKLGQRYISNSGAASMGYDLPAAIGASLAIEKGDVVCLSGDGSIQMNLQELQTIVFQKLPIKIFVINNEGYHSMRQTEGNLFPDIPHVGIGPETNDLSFPSMEKIAKAYGIPYVCANTNAEVDAAIDKTLGYEGAIICELFVATDQKFEPKSATKKLSDGTLVSPPLEDLAPFLDREELEQLMVIPLIEER